MSFVNVFDNVNWVALLVVIAVFLNAIISRLAIDVEINVVTSLTDYLYLSIPPSPSLSLSFFLSFYFFISLFFHVCFACVFARPALLFSFPISP